MDIVTTISDLCLVYAMCVPLIYIELKTTINPCMAVLTTIPVVILLMIPVFTILYPFRYGIAFMEAVFLAWMLFRYYRREIRPQNLMRDYFVEQLHKSLADVEVVWISMYGLDPRPTNKSLPQTYLFIDDATYFQLFDGHADLQMRWEFFEIFKKAANNAYCDTLFLILYLDRHDAPTIALPFHIGIQARIDASDDPPYKPSTIWTLMLQDLNMGAELNLYPLKKHHARKLHAWNTDMRYRRISPYMPYFREHIEHLPHMTVIPPPFPQDVLPYLMKQEHIDKLPEETAKFLDLSVPGHNRSYIYKQDLVDTRAIVSFMQGKGGRLFS